MRSSLRPRAQQRRDAAAGYNLRLSPVDGGERPLILGLAGEQQRSSRSSFADARAHSQLEVFQNRTQSLLDCPAETGHGQERQGKFCTPPQGPYVKGMPSFHK